MNYLAVDHLIVYAFLIITLLLGLWAGRDIKTIRDYAIANKTYGTGVLTITLLATYIGGWHLFLFPGEVFSKGISYVVPIVLCGIIVNLLFIARFIAPRLTHFKDALTMGDLMSSFYGENGRLLTGIIGVLYNTTAVSIQILFLHNMCAFLGIQSDWGLAISALVLTIYTAKGGMKSVAITDLVQFIAVVATVPLLAHLVVHKAGGVINIFNNIPIEKMRLFSSAQAGEFVSQDFYSFAIRMLWFLFPGYPLSFPFIQRMLMAKNEPQAVNVYYISTAFLTSFFALLTLIGLSTWVIAPQATSQTVVANIVSTLPVGFKGLIWAALLAVIMSTTDSFLHAAGVSLTHDLIAPLAKKAEIAINDIKVAQYATLFIGCLAIIVTLSVGEFHTITRYGMNFGAFLFTVPLIAGIMGLRTDPRVFSISFFTTATAFVLSTLYLPAELAKPVCIFVNILSFFGSHYVITQLLAVDRNNEEDPIKPISQSGKKNITYFDKVLNAIENIFSFHKLKAHYHNSTSTTFGLFIAFSHMVPLFMHGHSTSITYSWLIIIRCISILLCIGLFLQEKWPSTIRPYFSIYYYITLLYCLPFVTTFLFLLENGSIEWLVNVGLAIMLLIVLTDWITFISLSTIGITLAIALYVFAVEPTLVHLDIQTQYVLAYTVIFSSLVGFIFSRRKEQRIVQVQSQLRAQNNTHKERFLREAAERQATLRALQHTQVGELLTLARSMQSLPLTREAEADMEMLQKRLIPIAFQLQGLDARSQDYLRLYIQEDITLQDLTNSVRQKLHDSGSNVNLKIAEETIRVTIAGDLDQIATLLARTIASLADPQQESEENVVWMAYQSTQLCYPMPDVADNYTKRIAALHIAIGKSEQLPTPEAKYYPDLNCTHTLEATSAESLDRAANCRIVKAHYGHAATHDHGHTYVIPMNVQSVRPRDMDKAYMEVDAAPVRANDHFEDSTTGTNARAQEVQFLKDVAAKSDIDLGPVKMALELIKWYHGPANRKSGEPFYLHPLTVAHIALDYNQDEATIIGALLHDTVEDTPMLLEHIETVFGKETADVVDLVTHLQSTEGSIYKVKMSAGENLRMLEKTGNQRALYVKIADRMHNMRTIHGHSKITKRQLIARETTDFFIPMTHKLGLTEAAQEFERRCHEVMNQQ